MKTIEGKLKRENTAYFITHRRPFKIDGELLKEDVEECFEFSYEMAFGEGKHRSTRSGGSKERTSSEIFIDTFQGKAAEYAVYRFLLEHGIEALKPDRKVEGYGIWDSFDIEYEGTHMAIKSTKHYGNLLLLETKDWNVQGEYIPNSNIGICKYEVFVLVRISPDVETIMKDTISKNAKKEQLKEIIYNSVWEYNIAGHITDKDLKRLIEKEYVLPKGALLNGKTRMDAENYYVQAGDMREKEELLKRLKRSKEKIRTGLRA